MKPLETAKKTAQVVQAVLLKPGAPSADALDELARRAQVNREGRAKREAAVDALMGRRRWIPRRPGWL